MKKTIFIAITLIIISNISVYAQDIPKKEFAISIPEKNIEIQPGETKKYDITLLRSKSYKKTSINLQIDSSLPDGVTVSFENGSDPSIHKVMIVSADKNTRETKKAVILKGTSTRSSKGVMLNLWVK